MLVCGAYVWWVDYYEGEEANGSAELLAVSESAAVRTPSEKSSHLLRNCGEEIYFRWKCAVSGPRDCLAIDEV